MACLNTSNQNHVLPPMHCNARPAIFNLKDGSISFVPQHLTRNGPEVDFLNPQTIKKEYSFIPYPYLMTQAVGTDSRMIQRPHPLTNHLYGRDSRIIQSPHYLKNHLSEKEFKMVHGSHFLANPLSVPVPNKSKNDNLPQYQLFPTGNVNIQDFHSSTNQPENSSNLIQYSHLLQLPLSSNSQQAQGNENLHPITDQLSSNESKSHQQCVFTQTHQQSCSLPDRLPAIGTGINQNSNKVFQQPCRVANCMPIIKHSPNYGLSHIVPDRNHVKGLLTSQTCTKEATGGRGLQTIFQRPFIVQGQKIIKHQSSYPSCRLPEIGFILNRDLPLVHQEFSTFNASLLDSNKYPRYSENVHICVVGPPGSGKTDLIRTFARNDSIPIPTGKPFRKVFQQGMVCFGTNLIIDIWQVDDLTLAAEDLKSHCKFSKSVIVLVYNKAQKQTLSTVLEWIKFLKRHIVANVPVILVETNTRVKSSFDSKDFSGVQVQAEYELDAFYQCSKECIDDVEAVFLFAAHKAFRRKIQSVER